MRRKALVLFPVLAVAALAATAAGAASTPQIRREQAHARAVLARINRIGRDLEKVVQEYDGAKLQLATVDRNLRRNQFRLRLARRNFRVAQKRIMARLYSLYVDGRPTTLDVLAGASSLSQIIDRMETAHVLSNQDAVIGQQALGLQLRVQRREQLLKRQRQKRAAVVRTLTARRATIQGALAEQKRLYASDQATIRTLQAREAARQRRLQAAAERRLAEQRAAAARAAQQEQQQQQQQQTFQNAVVGDSSGSVATPPPIVSAPGSVGVGHPQAAQIALQYLGVPYVWGGASPGGFDCSGLVMYVYAQLGISLPHYTVAQWNATEPISPSQMQPGDLVFFDGLGHVGIYIGNGQFVDAPHTGAVVRIDSLSAWGGSFDGARRVP
jgi:cell wall-associated NlpC family hydrolase